MVKLVERALVKDLLMLPRADTMPDGILNGLIQSASDEAVRLTRRSFGKMERVEFRQSYDQAVADPEPQWLLMDAYPIDMAQPLKVEYSPYEWRPQGSILVLNFTSQDYTVEPDKGKIVVRGATDYVYTSYVPINGRMFTYSPRGFRVTYTGGYPVSVAPEGDPDPLDDYGVVQVDEGLKLVVAQQVASQYKYLRGNLEKVTKEDLSEAYRQDLKPFTKKDMI